MNQHQSRCRVQVNRASFQVTTCQCTFSTSLMIAVSPPSYYSCLVKTFQPLLKRVHLWWSVRIRGKLLSWKKACDTVSAKCTNSWSCKTLKSTHLPNFPAYPALASYARRSRDMFIGFAPTFVKLVNLVCNESDRIESVKNTDSELASFTSENVTLADILWCMLMWRPPTYIAAGAEADMGEMFKSQDLACDFPIFRKVQVFWLNFVFKFIDIRIKRHDGLTGVPHQVRNWSWKYLLFHENDSLSFFAPFGKYLLHPENN